MIEEPSKAFPASDQITGQPLDQITGRQTLEEERVSQEPRGRLATMLDHIDMYQPPGVDKVTENDVEKYDQRNSALDDAWLGIIAEELQSGDYQTQLEITEILRVFSTLRFLLPESIIKISGGREVNLKDDGQKLLLSGANGIISAGYLTMGGNTIKKDTRMINEINLET
jgi:hypothetical protein